MTEQLEPIDIEVDVPEEQKYYLLRHWANTKLSPASVYVFKKAIESGQSIEEAILNAVVNDCFVLALVTEIERQKLENPNKIVD